MSGCGRGGEIDEFVRGRRRRREEVELEQKDERLTSRNDEPDPVHANKVHPEIDPLGTVVDIA